MTRTSLFLSVLSVLTCASLVHAQVVIVDLTQMSPVPLNPRIYGTNFATSNMLQMGSQFNRNGGNAMTNWNWQIDATNSASDWYFENNPLSSSYPSGSTNDLQMDQTFAVSGATFASTVSTIGWVAKSRTKAWSFSIAYYGAQTSNECSTEPPGTTWCASDAGNGILVNGTYLRNNFSVYSSSSTQEAINWVQHMRTRAGPSVFDSNFVAMLDNEPNTWVSVHRDCHPSPLTYDELWNYTLNYSLALKTSFPNISISGPMWCCWCDYFWSASDGCDVSNANPDYFSHGSMYISPWLMKQVDLYKVTNGIQLLDTFDIHYYPNVPADESTQANQQQYTDEVRSFYDSTYSDPGWIGDTAPNSCGEACNGPFVNLIPRFQSWLSEYAPNSNIPLAISEYSFVNGGDEDDTLFSPTLANAEVLSVFAKYHLTYASRWVCPEAGSVAELAFSLYLNYDGHMSKVYGNVVAANSSIAPSMTSYAVYNETLNRVHVLLFNKNFSPQTVDSLVVYGAKLHSSTSLLQSANVYQFSVENQQLNATANVSFSYTSSNYSLVLSNYSLPSRSATLFVINGVGLITSGSTGPPFSSSSSSLVSTAAQSSSSSVSTGTSSSTSTSVSLSTASVTSLSTPIHTTSSVTVSSSVSSSTASTMLPSSETSKMFSSSAGSIRTNNANRNACFAMTMLMTLLSILVFCGFDFSF